MAFDNTRRPQYSGMNEKGQLLSRLRFSGIIRVWEIDERWKHEDDGEVPYWIVKDEYGASFLTFEKLLVDSLVVSEKYEVKGEIKIGKGGIYFLLREAKAQNKEYVPV